MRSKKLKITLIVIGFIILALFFLSVLIKTSYVQQRIIGLVKGSVSKSLGQELKIEKVEFDVCFGIVIGRLRRRLF